MKGYVKNISLLPYYVMKRTVNPSDIISASDIEKTYFARSGATDASSFVKWLREGVFLETSIWEVNITDDVEKEAKKFPVKKPGNKPKKKKRKKGAPIKDLTNRNVVPEVTAAYLVKARVEICKEMAAKCKDI